MRETLTQRPEFFQLNPGFHSLKRGLVVLGAGRTHKTTKFTDSSLRKNHGTLTNMEPTDWVWDSTLNRFALDFDNSNDLVSGSGSLIYGTAPFTISAWVNARSLGTDYVACKATGASTLTWIWYWIADGSLQYKAGTSLLNYSAAAVMTTGSWIHVCVTDLGTATAAGINQFKNGILLAPATALDSARWSDAVTNLLTVGNRSDAARAIDGRIADFCMWSRILSTSEISALADPSNVMLSGLLVPPRRRLWAVSGGGGGTAFSETVADAMGLTDAAAKASAFARTQTESLGMSDGFPSVATFSRTQTDNLGMTDVRGQAAAFARTQSDALGLTDAPTRAAAYLRTQADGVGLTDARTSLSAFTRTVADSEGLSDTVSEVFSGVGAAADGIDLRASDNRPHYSAINKKPHYRTTDNRPHYSVSDN